MVALKDIVPAAQNNNNTRFILLDKASMNILITRPKQDMPSTGGRRDGGGPLSAVGGGVRCIRARNSLLLRAGKRGKIEKVGEFTMAYVETPNMSEIRWVPDPTALTSTYRRL
ncbi:SOSS complex subunit B homolog isoform X1 [Prunus yedoensis var. nudiflora]|uniref:SOSS complex subunit B homolog isoform X1 n=1 Tax=Prunus yedoensis var. nudiflora TaxID=2094558 RepID=A0A314UC39_PRUYE|nr:SOSS complex subunit B homolog isoform X1 [Prunus yedoensis var. nudiflora]